MTTIEPKTLSAIEQMLQHRSIRKYKPDPVSDDLLSEVLQAGLRASSSGNMQVCSVIVTRDRALREQLYKPHMEQSMVLEAPVLLTFCADFHRMRQWLRLSDAPDNFDDFFSFMLAAIDTCLSAQNVALAAESRGLGICYMGSTFAHCDQIGAILKLPKNVVPIVGFSLGYPDEAPALRDRLPLDGIVHHETYQDYSDKRIREVYKEREVKGWDRYMSFPKLKELVEKSGVKNLAQIYTEVKYTRSDYNRYSRDILKYLAEQEFMNNGGEHAD